MRRLMIFARSPAVSSVRLPTWNTGCPRTSTSAKNSEFSERVGAASEAAVGAEKVEGSVSWGWTAALVNSRLSTARNARSDRHRVESRFAFNREFKLFSTEGL